MKILALEFSSSKRSVAVLVNGATRGYAERASEVHTPALGMVEEALRSAALPIGEVDRIAVGLGPGSYTGIRMALALLQGFAMARSVEVVGVSSMLAAATAVPNQGVPPHFYVVVSAQRGEFYLGHYDDSEAPVGEVAPVRIVAASEVRLLLQAGERVLATDAGQWLPEAQAVFPDARAVAKLAARKSPDTVEELKPIYLRQTTFTKVTPIG